MTPSMTQSMTEAIPSEAATFFGHGDLDEVIDHLELLSPIELLGGDG